MSVQRFNNLLSEPPVGSHQKKILILKEVARHLTRAELDTVMQEMANSSVPPAQKLLDICANRMIVDQVATATFKVLYELLNGSSTPVLVPSTPVSSYLSTLLSNNYTAKLSKLLSDRTLSQIRDDLALELEILDRMSHDVSITAEASTAARHALDTIKTPPPEPRPGYPAGSEKGKLRMAALKTALAVHYSKVSSTLVASNIDPKIDFQTTSDAVISFKTTVLGNLENDSQFQQLVSRGRQLASTDPDSNAVQARALKNAKETHIVTGGFNNYVTSTSNQIKEFSTNIEQIKATIANLETRIKENVDTIRANPDEYEENQKRVRQNAVRLNFLTELAYKDLDPEDQLEALKRGYFSDLPEKEQKGLKETVELKHFVKNKIGPFAHGADEVLAGIDFVNGLVGNPITIPEGVRTAAKAAGPLVDLGLALIPPCNLMGAASAVGQLMGLTQKTVDVGASRHKEVMEALGKLAQGQALIHANTEKLLKYAEVLEHYMLVLNEQQKAMYEKLTVVEGKIDFSLKIQVEILDKLNNLDDTVKSQFKTIMEELGKLREQISVDNFNMYYGLYSRVIDIYQTANRQAVSFGFSANLNRFQNYASLKEFYNDEATQDILKEGLPALRNAMYISPLDETGSIFALGNHASTSWVPGYVNLYNKFWETIQGLSPLVDFAFFAGLYPSNDVSQLKVKMKMAELGEQEKKELYPKRLYELFYGPAPHKPTPSTLLKQAYSFNLVSNYVEFAIHFHFIFDVWKPDTKELKTLEELAEETAPATNGQELLQSALLRLDALLVQQTLRGGDCYLPAFYGIWRNGQPSDKYTALKELFEKDELLAHNFFIYALREEVTRYDPDYFRYTMALKIRGDASKLKDITDHPWEFVYIGNKGWEVHFAGHAFPLPSALDLHKGVLAQVNAVKEIFKLRQRVIQELHGYNLVHSLYDPPLRKMYMTALYAGE